MTRYSSQVSEATRSGQELPHLDPGRCQLLELIEERLHLPQPGLASRKRPARSVVLDVPSAATRVSVAGHRMCERRDILQLAEVHERLCRQ